MRIVPYLFFCIFTVSLFNDHGYNILSVDAALAQIVLAGGTGKLGQALASKLSTPPYDHDVTILTRNAFLAATPARVSEQFGWVGEQYMKKHPQVQLRDWDGGDLLDIVGKDWIGWQQDALADADVVVHLVGGYTQQRIMACERLVRESYAIKNQNALHITVNPISDEDLNAVSPGYLPVKNQRIDTCEKMVQTNCINSKCMRIEAYRIEKGCDEIVSVIDEWCKNNISN